MDRLVLDVMTEAMKETGLPYTKAKESDEYTQLEMGTDCDGLQESAARMMNMENAFWKHHLDGKKPCEVFSSWALDIYIKSEAEIWVTLKLF